MNRSPRPQRVAEFLLRRACRSLPEEQAEECFAAWAGELPAILSDPDLSGLRAAWRAVAFAFGQFRTAEELAARQPADTLDAAKALPLTGAFVLLAVTSDSEGVVGSIGTAAAGILAVVGCIALRPKRARARPHVSERSQRSDTWLLRQAQRRQHMPEEDVPGG
ncbi:hypothetical protein [Streptomyces sp. OK228]|jgi:hypothetical protein|uniref:hypothetical protein n=1 Tax=Streptomyces sp. OK228 TaxID=1882786 RepID=UPI000BD779A4|nr:hypothetical protein [Streptomyces sp. OK228]SOE19083.1 hypothetical protein SAMN05442782_0026 [Streptomyces sp. OK228]